MKYGLLISSVRHHKSNEDGMPLIDLGPEPRQNLVDSTSKKASELARCCNK